MSVVLVTCMDKRLVRILRPLEDDILELYGEDPYRLMHSGGGKGLVDHREQNILADINTVIANDHEADQETYVVIVSHFGGCKGYPNSHDDHGQRDVIVNDLYNAQVGLTNAQRVHVFTGTVDASTQRWIARPKLAVMAPR